jgi:predicted SnoaL-like aldol condensation-catalyzing enzyme
MKTLNTLLLSLLLAISAEASSAKPSNPNQLQAANKKVVLEFYELAFNQHKPTEAAKKYFGDHYIQHNPKAGNGAKAFYEYFEAYYKKHPKTHVKIYHVLADKDLVVLHLNSKMDDQDLGRAVVDIFRLENGKIVEHFDVK